MISPSVGRKVWYRPSAFDLAGAGAMAVASGQPLDATVLAVWGPRCVSVQVLDINGKAHTRTSVTLLQPDEVAPLHGPDDKDGNPTPGGFVEWMPYQKGQATKEREAVPMTAQQLDVLRSAMEAAVSLAASGATHSAAEAATAVVAAHKAAVQALTEYEAPK